jgi:hypothetical protein
MDIVEIGMEKYLCPDGRFDVFLWTGSSWKNLYKNNYHGYNFGSRKFVCDEKIYSFGGYGYWHQHGQIIAFSPKTGEWELISTAPHFPYAFSYMKEGTLHIYADSLILVELGWNKKITRSPNPYGKFFPTKSIPTQIEVKDFLIIPEFNALIDKSHHSLFLSDKQVFEKLKQSKRLVHAYVNLIALVEPDNGTSEYIHVPEKLPLYSKMPAPEKKSHPFRKPGLVGVMALAVLGLWYVFRKKWAKNSLPNRPSIDPELNDYLQKLAAFSGKILTSEQLDDILALTSIPSADTQRFKRFQLIKEINQEYRKKMEIDLIVRQRDPEDGRRYLYFIQ